MAGVGILRMSFSGILVIEKSQAFAEDEVGEERAERSFGGICPESKEEENADERPSPEKGLKIVELKHGAKDGGRSDGERRLSLTTKEHLEGVGWSDVYSCTGVWHIALAVKEEAEASTDDRTNAHIKIVAEQDVCSFRRRSRCKNRMRKAKKRAVRRRKKQ